MISVAPHDRQQVRLVVNGVPRCLEVESRWLLSDVLRQQLGLTGTHVGCEHGACGACTILLDGEPARACLALAISADGMAITTIEGLAAQGRLGRLEQAFSQHGAVQCGFCTPGMLVACTALLSRGQVLSRQEIREALTGQLCRCTGYEAIIDAVRTASVDGTSGARGTSRDRRGTK